jgi:hypothetical protein
MKHDQTTQRPLDIVRVLLDESVPLREADMPRLLRVGGSRAWSARTWCA